MCIQDTMPEQDETSAATETPKGEDDKGTKTEETEEKPEAKDKEDEAKNGEEEKQKKPKIDPKDWPLRGIKEHTDNDVLFGRGGAYLVAVYVVVLAAYTIVS